MQQNVLPAQGKVNYLEALEIAIEREIKARFMYVTMARYAKETHMKRKLEFLAQEEDSHKVNLQDLYQKISGLTRDFDDLVKFPDEGTAASLASVEMADLLRLAIGKETEASQFYVVLAGNSSDPSMKEIFNYLAEEELTHRRMLELQLKLYVGERPMGNEASVEMVPGVYKEWW